MPRTPALIAVGAAIFAAALVVMFPARVAYHAFAPTAVRLSGISGSVWNGTAAEGRAGELYLSNLTWSFRPLALLSGKAGYAVTADLVSGFIAGDVAIAPGGSVHFSDLTARVPISAVGGLAAAAGVDGMLDLELESLVLRDGLPVRGTGTIRVADLVASQLARAPLGSYEARVQTVDDVLSADIADISGALDLAGTLELRADRSYLLSGRVAATAAAPQGVAQQLSYLGSPDAEGMRAFRFEGKL